MPFGYGDGGGGPTREMLERPRRLADLDGMPQRRARHAGRVLRPRRGRGRRRRAGAGVARRAVLRDPPRHVDEPAAHEARQPALRAAAARGRAVDGARPAARPARARRAVAGGADAAVPRHHPRLVDRLGPRRRRGGPRPRRRRARGAHRRRCSASCAPAGPARGQRRDRRPRRGRRHATSRRPATGRCSASPTAASPFRAPVPGLGLAPAVARRRRRPRRRHRPLDGQRPPRRELGPRRQPDARSSTSPTPASCCPPGASRPCSSWRPTIPSRYDAWDLESWTRDASAPPLATADVGRRSSSAARSSARCACDGRSAPSSATVTLRRCAPGRRASTSTSTSTGTTTSTCCRWRSRSTCAPTRRRAASSSAPCGARPTRRRSWDAAKFEVCAHRYVDVAEPAFGVAVLNDGRYGHGAVRRRASGSAWLRGARYPDPDADQGRHEVTLALFPHGAGLADVVAEAERLNLPLRVVAGGGRGRRPAPVVSRHRRAASRSTPSRSPTTAPATSIVRLHEACGDRAPRDGAPPTGGSSRPAAATCSRSRPAASRSATASSRSRCARSSW